MIVFNLICKICSAEFEGWFENAREFDNQKRKKISNIIIKNNNIINENIVGTNYLEKLKYLVINNLKDNKDKFTINNLEDDLEKKIINQQNLNLKTNH